LSPWWSGSDVVFAVLRHIPREAVWHELGSIIRQRQRLKYRRIRRVPKKRPLTRIHLAQEHAAVTKGNEILLAAEEALQIERDTCRTKVGMSLAALLKQDVSVVALPAGQAGSASESV